MGKTGLLGGLGPHFKSKIVEFGFEGWFEQIDIFFMDISEILHTGAINYVG